MPENDTGAIAGSARLPAAAAARGGAAVSPDPVKVTVILVTYNHERFVARALDSLLSQQTGFDYEIVVSEDCSTDATRAIVRGYAERFPDRMRLCLSERNLNSNYVTTRAIEAARGEYLAFIDGDDYAISPRKLQVQSDFLDANPQFAMCYHNAEIVDEHDKATGRLHVKPSSPKLDGLPSILAANPVPGPSPMIRRSAVERLPDWFENAPFGDWPLYILAARSGRIGYIDETLSAYRVHPGGFWAGTSRSQQYGALLDWYDYLIRHMPQEHSQQLARRREAWRTSDWYVADLGPEFLALYDRGVRWPDRFCSPELRLKLTPANGMDGLRLRLANLDVARAAGNRIEVEVGGASEAAAGLAPGQEVELGFSRPFPAGEPVWISVRSATAIKAPEEGREGSERRIGFRLDEVAPVHETRPRRD